MKTKANSQRAVKHAQPPRCEHAVSTCPDQRGFTMAELMIAMAVFTLIIGSVVMLLGKSQTIFRTEQGVSEMDQNARLLMDFLTRDIQQSKENALGLGSRFRSIYSHNGPEGKTDEVTIVSSDTESKLPSAALPLIASSTKPFSTDDRYVEILPNGASRIDPRAVIDKLLPNEEFIVSASLQDGSIQFDFIKIKAAKLTETGAIGISFEPVEHRGVEPEVAFGGTYEGGAFTMRPCAIKRYFVDRKSDPEHPVFALSVNDSPAIPIARNVVAFQVRYLEIKDGEVDGQWVKQQHISRLYKSAALEVTMTARTEIKSDQQAERLVTLASVIRPRFISGGAFGSSPGGGGTSSPGVPGDGVPGGGGNDFGDGSGGGPGGSGGGSPGGPASRGRGFGSDNGLDDPGGFGAGGYNHETRRIGKQPKLGERLNQRND
jgi:prepilin-type N-terminal cleavage/methylation domain-containing protein